MTNYQFMPAERSCKQRFLSIVLAVLMLIGIIPSPITAKAEDTSGGFTLSLSWQGAVDKDGNESFTDNYWDSDSDEDKLVRLKVSYSNKNVHKGSASGDIETGDINITFKGIKGVVRSGSNYIPASVAADKGKANADNPSAWSYSYSSITDTYVFSNNKKCEEGSTFEGSFEIVWEIPTRRAVDGFTDQIQAELTVADISVQSNTVNYEQHTQKDTYQLGAAAKQLFNYAGLDSVNYLYASYDVTNAVHKYARAINGDVRYECYFLEGAEVTYHSSNGILVKDETKTKQITDGTGTHTYECWYLDIDAAYGKEKDILDLKDILVAYPKQTYGRSIANNDDYDFDIYAELYGTYYDEQEEVLLSEANADLKDAQSDLQDVPGPIYDVSKYSKGENLDTFDSHCEHCKKQKGINYSHLSNGGYEYTSELRLELNYPANGSYRYDYDGDGVEEEKPTDITSFNFEFTDDFLDVELDDGSYHQLDDDEYEFTKIIIPPKSKVKNATRELSGDYDIEIYALVRENDKTLEGLTYDGEVNYSNYTKVGTYKLGGAEQIVSLPEKTIAFKIRVNNVKECFYAGYDFYEKDPNPTQAFKCCYKLYLKDTQAANTNGGKLYNNFYFILDGYNDEGEKVFQNDAFTIKEYAGNNESEFASLLDELSYERDVEYYGATETRGYDREKDYLHIIEIPSRFLISYVTLKCLNSGSSSTDSYNFTGDIAGSFTLGEGEGLTNFSIYTIVPEGLDILSKYEKNPELLKSVLKFYMDGNQSSLLEDNVEIIITPDYNGSSRAKIEFKFTFDSPVTMGNIKISGIPMYVYYEDVTETQTTYTMYASMLVHQDGKWTSNSTDGYAAENGLWVDMDGDKVTTEQVSSNGSSVVTLTKAFATAAELKKFISSQSTEGYIWYDKFDEECPNNQGEAYTIPDGEYSYKIRTSIGNNDIQNFVLLDIIETAENYQWQGHFARVDCSKAEKIIGEKAEVYYSTEEAASYAPTDENDKGQMETAVALINEDLAKAGSEGSIWKVLPDNPSEELLKSVKTIAVSFGDAVIPSGSVISIEVFMTAPTQAEAEADEADPLYHKLTRNESAVYYEKLDTSGVPEESQYLPSNAVTIEFSPYKGNLELVKKDEEDYQPISGAKFELYRFSGTNAEWEAVDFDSDDQDVINGVIGKSQLQQNGTEDYFITDEDGKIVVEDLEFGHYFFKEIYSPDGYTVKKQLIKADLTKASEGDSSVKVTVKAQCLEQRKDGKVNLRKKSDKTIGGNPIYLEGAEFELYKADGEKVGTYETDENGYIKVEGLEWGDYYFKETKAPEGYELYEEKISFTIDASNDAGRRIGDYYGDGEIYAITVTDAQKSGVAVLTKYEKLEDGTITTTPVKGAYYTLYQEYNGDSQALGTYRTDENGKIYLEDLIFGASYYISEDSAVAGYGIDSNKIAITVTSENIGENYFVAENSYDQRKTGAVSLKKINDAKENVGGAEFELYKKAGDEWVKAAVTKEDSGYKYSVGSDTGVKLVTDVNGELFVKGLYWGDYYLVETKAAQGYELSSEKHYFTISASNADNGETFVKVTAVNERKKGNVKLIKYDEESYNNDPENATALKGAKFTLYKNDATVVAKDLVTNENGEIIVNDLEWGGYYFKETQAPSGYALSEEKYSFTISRTTVGKTLEVVATDPTLSYTIMLAKRIKVSDIVFEHGNPTFTFKVEKVNGSDIERTYYTSVTFDEKYVNENQGADGYVEAFATLAVDKGDYRVTETETNRYELESIKLTKNGTEQELTNGETVFTVDDADIKYVVTCQNKKVDQTGTSHTDFADNIVHTQRKLTGLAAFWLDDDGNVVYDGTPLVYDDVDSLYDKMRVYAIYDDGSEQILDRENLPEGGSDFIIKTSTGDEKTNGKENIKIEDGYIRGDTVKIIAKYTEGGRTRTDSIEVEIEIPDPFTVYFVQTNLDQAANTRTVRAARANTNTVNFNSDDVEAVLDSSKLIEQDLYKGGNTGSYNDELSELTNSYYNQNRDGVPILKEYSEDNLTKYVDENGEEYYGFVYINGYTGTATELTIPDEITGVRLKETNEGGTDYTVIPELCDKKFKVLGIGRSDAVDSVETAEKEGNVLPDIVSDYSITGMSSVKTLTIADEIKRIGPCAFNSLNITTLNLAETENSMLSYIGSYSFCANNYLRGDLVIPNSVKTIGSYAFCSCSANAVDSKVLDVTIGSSVETIRTYAFYGSQLGGYGITSVNFNKDSSGKCNLKLIGAYAFGYNFKYKKELVIPASNNVMVISDYVFYQSNGINSLKFDDGSNLKTIGDYAFYGCYGLDGALEIPKSVTTIGNTAFRDCWTLDSLTFESGSQLKIIGDNAFNGCTQFKGDLTFPQNVRSIGASAFYNCNGFDGKLTLPTNVDYSEIQEKTFYLCRNFTGDVMIPVSVTKIGERAFQQFEQNSSNPGRLILENSFNLQTIGKYAFRQAGFIGDLIIPVNTTEIYDYAFYKSKFNGTLTFAGKNITTINPYAFRETSFTGDLTIPNSVTYLGSYAFYKSGFNGRLIFEVNSKLEYLGAYKNSSTSRLTVSTYVFAETPFTGDLVIPENVKQIYEGTFYKCGFNGTLTFKGRKITSIGKNAFQETSFTGDLTIPYSVNSLETQAFYKSGFNGRLIFEDTDENPSQLTQIGSSSYTNVFAETPFTGDLVIPRNVETIGNYAFDNCTFTGSVTFNGEKITTIGDGAFRITSGTDSGNITSIELPDSITTIGNSAFYHSRKLTSLKLPANLETIGNSAFQTCNGIKGDLIIPDKVTTIGQNAFNNCTGFNGKLVIGESVQEIKPSAFSYVWNVTSIEFKTNVLTTIGDSAFYSILGNKVSGDVYIPTSVTSIGTNAFYYYVYSTESSAASLLHLPKSFEGSGDYYGYYESKVLYDSDDYYASLVT